MKTLLELSSETCAATAALLWFVSAQIRFKERTITQRGLSSGVDDPKALLRLVYEQSRWSAWAAVAAGLAAVFAILDGLVPNT